MTDRRATELEQRAQLVRSLVEELEIVKGRCLRLGLALDGPIDTIVSQLMSEWHWCTVEAHRRRALSTEQELRS